MYDSGKMSLRYLRVLYQRFTNRCPANMAHVRQSRPVAGGSFQVKVLEPL